MERAKTARSMGPEVEKTHSGAGGKGVRSSVPSFCSPTPSPLTNRPHLLLPGIFPSPSSLPCPSPTFLCLFSHLCGGGGRGGGSQEQVSSLQHNPGPVPFRYTQLCLSSRGGGDSGPRRLKEAQPGALGMWVRQVPWPLTWAVLQLSWQAGWLLGMWLLGTWDRGWWLGQGSTKRAP